MDLKNVLMQAKYAMTAFDSKWKYEQLVDSQNLNISRSCFSEDGKEMYKDL